MDFNPLSPFVDGSRSTLGGACIFVLGLMGGVGMGYFVLDEPWPATEPYLYPLLTLVALLHTITRIWGFLLVPVYFVVLFGLVGDDWSRLRCFLVLVIWTSFIVVLSHWTNPLKEPEMVWRYLMGNGMLSTVLIASYVSDRAHNRTELLFPPEPSDENDYFYDYDEEEEDYEDEEEDEKEEAG